MKDIPEVVSFILEIRHAFRAHESLAFHAMQYSYEH